MKKFVLGVISTLGAIGIGKKIYEKGRKDGIKELHDDFSNIQKGIEIGIKEESE